MFLFSRAFTSNAVLTQVEYIYTMRYAGQYDIMWKKEQKKSQINNTVTDWILGQTYGPEDKKNT